MGPAKSSLNEREPPRKEALGAGPKGRGPFLGRAYSWVEPKGWSYGGRAYSWAGPKGRALFLGGA